MGRDCSCETGYTESMPLCLSIGYRGNVHSKHVMITAPRNAISIVKLQKGVLSKKIKTQSGGELAGDDSFEE